MGKSSQEKRMSLCKMLEIRPVSSRQLAKLIKRCGFVRFAELFKVQQIPRVDFRCILKESSIRAF